MADQGKKALAARLQNTSITDSIAAAIDGGKGISDIIKIFSDANTVSDSQLAELQFIQGLSEVTQDAQLFYFLLQSPAKTLSDVARRLYDPTLISHAPPLDRRVLQNYQQGLFSAYPTATILGLVEHETIHVPDFHDKLVELFVFAVDAQFNISTTSIETILQDQAYLDKVDADTRTRIATFARTLQRLQALVTDAAHIGALLDAGITCAHDIAASTSDLFTARVTPHGITNDAADSIFVQARAIDARNEAIFVEQLRKRNNIPVLAIGESANNVSSTIPSFENMFGEFDSIECDQWTSILSPAAYLTDLLHFLKTSSVAGPNTPTLYDQLKLRRPDLSQLNLSKDNTLTLVRYLDLVNEIMESYIGRLATTPPIPLQVFNDAAFANHTIWPIYENKMPSMYAPLREFPYNLGTTLSRSLMTGMNITRRDTALLVSPLTPAGFPEGTNKVAARRLADEALGRFRAAEHLNLSQEDFIAITGEAFESYAYTKACKKQSAVFTLDDYRRRIKVVSTGEYWGFSGTDATDAMLGKIANEPGLADIKRRLLPRSSLSLPQLLDVLQTEFIARRLVINIQQPPYTSATFANRLDEMRLCNNPLVGGSVNLTKENCHQLQAFIRLWHRADLQLDELDAALVTFASTELSGSPVSQKYIITAETVVKLSAVKELSTLTKLSILELLPLWGDMRSSGPRSLYAQLFLTPNVLSRFPSIAQLDADGATTLLIKDTISSLAMACGCTVDDVQVTCTLLGIDGNATWSLARISAIYRWVLLCHMLGIEIAQLPAWRAIYDDLDPFADARRTLEATASWLKLCETSDAATRLDLLGRVSLTSATTVKIVTEFWKTITTSPLLARIVTILSSADKAEPIPDDLIISVVQARYPSVAAVLPQLIDGSLTFTASCPTAPASLDTSLVNRLTFDQGSQALILHGLLTAAELKDLKSANEKDVNVSAAIRQLEDQTTALSAACSDLSSFFVPSGDQDSTITRRRSFLQSVWLHVVDLPATTGAYCNDRLSSLDKTLTESFKKSPVFDSRALADNFAGVVNGPILKSLANVEGVLIAPSTGLYAFQLEDQAQLIIQKGLTTSRLTKGSASIQLQQGESYIVSGRGALSQPNFAVDGAKITLSATNFIPAAQISAFSGPLIAMERTIAMCKEFRLKYADYEQLSAVNMAEMTPATAMMVVNYAKIRAQHGSSGPRSLHDLLSGLSGASTVTDCCKLLARFGGWSEQNVQLAFGVYSPSLSSKEILSLITNPTQLDRLRSVLELCRRTAVSPLDIATWSAVPPAGRADSECAIARQVQAVALASRSAAVNTAIEKVAEQKRDVLVRCILSLPELLYLENNADKLYELLLVDVQMGSQTETSRLQQAIATVQLYIARCQLGLETYFTATQKLQPVLTTAIDESRWSWMSKFNMWQANRKILLYPENWLEGSLRDDKSDAFKAAESLLMQSNCNLDTINDIVREYIYRANDVGDIQIQSYLFEKQGTMAVRYHIFGRSRTAPYTFWYRVLEDLSMHSDEPRHNWYPWSKIDTDIPTFEVEWDATALQRSGTYLLPTLYRGRLYLFIPQIIAKQKPKALSGEKFEKFATDGKVAEAGTTPCWEIKMGWTEYRKGKWSKKQVTSIGVEAGATSTILNVMPSIASFQFQVSERGIEAGDDSIVVIDVGQRHDSKDAAGQRTSCIKYHIGRFELRGTRMVVAKTKPEKYDGSTALPTDFHMLPFESSAGTDVLVQQQLKERLWFNNAPLSVIAPWIADMSTGAQHSFTWIVSHQSIDDQTALALVLERTTANRVESYFGFPKMDMTPTSMAINISKTTTSTQFITHTAIQALMEVTEASSGIGPVLALLESMPAELCPDVYGIIGKARPRELATPYALYNWELGFHILSLIVEKLKASQQFELALQIARLIFDPRRKDNAVSVATNIPKPPAAVTNTTAVPKTPAADGISDAAKPPAADTVTPSSDKSKAPFANCWRFKPFKGLTLAARSAADINNWLLHPFSPHAAARDNPAIYMKRFVMIYIETLLDQGDFYFRQPSLESVPLAMQRYIEASYLFGGQLRSLPLIKPVIKNFDELLNLDDLSNTNIDLEVKFPFFVKAINGVKNNYKSMMGMIRTPYFPVPPNPKLAELRELIDDRFFKIRNGLDIDGNVRHLPLFDPPLDPGALAAGMASGGLSSQVVLADGPMPHYRFVYLLQKAFELCNELRSVGEAFLAAIEKKDAEALSNLRATQDLSYHQAGKELKQLQKADAEKAITTLQDTRSSHVLRLKYYLALSGESLDKIPSEEAKWVDIEQSIAPRSKDELVMSPQEQTELNKSQEASELSLQASALEAISGVLLALPNLTTQVQPLGVGAGIKFDAANIAHGMTALAGVMKLGSQVASDEASRASRRGQLMSQLQERRLQANQAGRDIKNIDLQIEAQRLKVKMCDAELSLHDRQAENLAQMEAYLKEKYTNASLYTWMESALRRSFYDTYVLAMQAAKGAEKAYFFERSNKQGPMLEDSYWSSNVDGLLSSHGLYMGLKRLENAYQSQRGHDYELTKNISLRQLDPVALLSLQETGQAGFWLDEMLYDYDFPGQYCRRVKSVSVTINCIVGPYTGTSCTLRLLEHYYRTRLFSGSAKSYYAEEKSADDRYHSVRVPIDSVAISSGQNDAGVFDLNFMGERHGPFEGAGAISKWLLELSPIRQFDYTTISDVVLQVRYTAMDGGVVWKSKAVEAIRKQQAENSQRQQVALIDAKERLFSQRLQISPDATAAELNIKDIAAYLPYWTSGKGIQLSTIAVLTNLPISTPDSSIQGISPLKEASWEVPGSSLKVYETDQLPRQTWTDLKLALAGLTRDVLEQKAKDAAKTPRLWLLLTFKTS